VNIRPFSSAVQSPRSKTLCIAIAILLCAGCAKVPPTYFPEPPASPRLQLLKSFNNEGSLRGNASLNFLLGEDLGDRFSKALGMTFSNGRLFVADSGKSSSGLAIVDFEKNKIAYIKTGLTKPISVAVDRDGSLFVSDVAEGTIPCVVVYTPQYQFLRRISFDKAPAIFPAAIALSDNTLYVADTKANLVYALDKQSGKILRTIGQDVGLGWPTHIAVTKDGNLLVTESGAQRVRLFSPEGKLLQAIGAPGDRLGTFTRPKAAAADHDGNIYAVDVAFANVQAFDAKGNPLLAFGSMPQQPSKTLIMPAGIAITYDRMDIFQKYAAPGFTLEYVLAVSSQGAPPDIGSKITLYGFGKLAGYDYTVPEPQPEPAE